MTEPALQGVIRIPVPPSDREMRRPLAQRRPVLIEGGMKSWPAFTRWTLDHLIERAGACEVSVRNYTENVGVPRHLWKQYCVFEKMTFAAYLEKIRAGTAKSIYLAQVNIPKDLKPLLADIEKPAFLNYTTLDPVIWIGPGGHVEPLHFDTAHSVIGEVVGRKRVKLFPPTSYFALYPFPWWSPIGSSFSRVDVDNPDLSLFPRVTAARSIECTLEAGDVLFIPAGWWHQVYCLETHAVSVTYFAERRTDELLADLKDPWCSHFEAAKYMRGKWSIAKGIGERRMAAARKLVGAG
jgi:hypothetical protein